MKSIENLLIFLNENWTTILICIGLLIGLYKKTKAFFNQKQEDQISAIKSIIKEIVLELVAKAEKDYSEDKGAGAIKRSQVIKQIYNEYPVLSKASNQEEIIDMINKEIDSALENIADIFNKD